MRNRYRFKAVSPDGRLHRGNVEAPDRHALAAVLASRDLLLLEARSARRSRWRRAPTRELAMVFRNLSELTRAGVPLGHALATSTQLCRGPLQATLAASRQRLGEGLSLGRALDDGSGAIPQVVLSLVQAGEYGGQLPVALGHVTQELERQAEQEARIRQALSYPVLLVAAGTVSVCVLILVVLPRLAELLADAGGALPESTRWLLAGASAMQRHWPAGVVAVAIVAAGMMAALQTESGKLKAHTALLRIPLVGPIRRRMATARICGIMGSMLASGSPMHRALAAGRLVAGDRAIERRLEEACKRVEEGQKLSSALEVTSSADPVAIQMARIGETSGRLGQMLERAGELARKDGEHQLARLVTLLEPALILVFGGVVALVAAAMLQAVYGLRV